MTDVLWQSGTALLHFGYGNMVTVWTKFGYGTVVIWLRFGYGILDLVTFWLRNQWIWLRFGYALTRPGKKLVTVKFGYALL